MISKSVSVYDKGEAGLYLHSSVFTTMGILLAAEPLRHVDAIKKKQELWPMVTKALETSGGIIDHPEEWNQLSAMIKQAGFRNWRTFAKDAHMCAVDVLDEKYRITPHKWDGKGFQEQPQKSLVISLDTDDDECTSGLLQCLG